MIKLSHLQLPLQFLLVADILFITFNLLLVFGGLST